jgi:hypothetical protein
MEVRACRQRTRPAGNGGIDDPHQQRNRYRFRIFDQDRSGERIDARRSHEGARPQFDLDPESLTIIAAQAEVLEPYATADGAVNDARFHSRTGVEIYVEDWSRHIHRTVGPPSLHEALVS